MSEEIKSVAEAVEKLNVGFKAAQDANEQRLSQIEAKGAADPVTLDMIEKINADLDIARKTADEAVLATKRRERVVTDAHGNAIDMEAKAVEWAQFNAPKAQGFTAEAMDAYNGNMRKYMRIDDRSLTSDEIKSLSVGGDPQGGYMVHPDLSGRMVTQVFETSPMRAYASIMQTTSDEVGGTFDLDEAGAEWVGETEARTETTTPKIGRWSIPVHELSANPAATQQMLDDAAFNPEQWLAEKVAAKFGRKESEAFVKGDGIRKPRGFLNYTDGTTLPGTIEQIATGVSGDLPAAPNGGDSFIKAIYALKAPYRAGGTWFMNRATTEKARLAKDSDGRYMWSESSIAGQPATLFGYPVASFEDMPDPDAGSLSIAFGDMRSAYQIVDRVGIRVLRDPYTNKPFVHFTTTKRVGGDVVNFEALKLIRFGA